MNKKTAVDFFSALLSDPAEKVTFRCFKDRDKTGDQKLDAKKAILGEVSKVLPLLEKVNASTWGTYFIVNATNGGTADKDVTHARALFIDIDDSAAPEFYALDPSCVLRRSDGGGYHIYWFLRGKETDLEKWASIQKTLIRYYKSDKTIHNPARLMRIPGSANHKEGRNSSTYEIFSMTEKRYTMDEVLLAHTDEKARLRKARRDIAHVFDGEKLEDGEGRHAAFVKVAFILNDYGFSGADAKKELLRANEKYLKTPYTDEELDTFLKSQKYAKNENGAVAVGIALELQQKIDHMKDRLKNWYYVAQDDKYFSGKTVLSTAGFNNFFMEDAGGVTPSRFCAQYKCLRTYARVTYDPAEEKEIREGDNIILNEYEAPELEPVEKNPDWFLSHIEYLIPEKIEREHFLNYLSYLIQNPGEKIMHGVLIIGRQGIGKSILHRVFCQIFGESNVSAPHNENLSGSFTGWARHCQLVVINELMQVDKRDFVNKIKPFITEPHVEIREMYRAPYTIKNCMNFIAFSNHDNALYVEKDDRRWFVVNSPAVRKAPEYYDTLIDNIDNRCGEVLHYLQTRDISAFRPGATPPMTKAKQTIIDYSVSDLEAWIVDAIESKSAPFDCDLVTIQDIRDNLPRQMQNGYTTQNRIVKILTDAGAVKLENRIATPDGSYKSFWAVRDVEKYAAKAYAEKYIKGVFGSSEKSGFSV